MTIKVRIKNVYGNDLIYPACNTSQALTRMKGTKTLSTYDIELLKGIGWTIQLDQGATTL